MGINQGPLSLDQKYTQGTGHVFLTGIQALVRLPMAQIRRDRAMGLNTAGFIYGYRGSPLGGYDQQLFAARKHLEQYSIKFQPGVNEDLAATTIWGSQQLNLSPGARYDGVVGIYHAVWCAGALGIMDDCFRLHLVEELPEVRAVHDIYFAEVDVGVEYLFGGVKPFCHPANGDNAMRSPLHHPVSTTIVIDTTDLTAQVPQPHCQRPSQVAIHSEYHYSHVFQHESIWGFLPFCALFKGN